MAKKLSFQNWIEELLPEGYLRKAMFGGFAYYLDEKLILVIFESPGDRTYKNITVDYDIWDGCMFPVEKAHQDKAKKLFPVLRPHIVLPKWLYLPKQSEDFEAITSKLIKAITKYSNIFGVYPKPKRNKPKLVKRTTNNKRPLPTMFSDEPPEERLKNAKKISDLKNLGPQTELQFKKAGITTVKQFVKLGWKKSMEKLVKVNPKNRHSMFAYAMIGALQNEDINGISEEDKMAAKKFIHSLKNKN